MFRSLVLALLALAVAAPIAAQPADDDVAPIDLAGVLVRDGKFDRAARALGEIDESDDDLDRAAFYTVRALMHHGIGDLDAACADFERAIAAGQDELQVHLTLAQAYFTRERWREAIRTLERAADQVDALPSVPLMKAQAWWMLDERQRALDTLAAAAPRFPGNAAFARRQVQYLVEAGLYATAASIGARSLADGGGGPEDYAAVGAALRRTRAFDEALLVLEAGALRFPEAAAVAKVQAQVLLEAGKPLAAAEVLARLAERDTALLAEAAELFRRAGHPQRALALNARIGDSAKKLKQRVGILVELRRYDQVTALEPAIARAGLLEDQDLRYALAYAAYRAGDFAAAERHLATLARADLFRKATELRKLMQDCADTPWSCA